YRRTLREHAARLLAPVENGRVRLAGAPRIGFLDELYPELRSFWLPLSEVRQLAQAWSIYDRGVPMAVLGFALHPFYGTYLPKRTEHLELFGTWLSGWQGPRRHAIDVGTGSGVLAFQLARAGFARVTATDVNPNACESVRRELARRPLPVVVEEGDLLGAGRDQVDLVVFNPPWTQGPVETWLDRALHYEETSLFTRFFDQAAERLAPEGRVVLVFSNVMRLVQPDEPHPIEVELERGRFERLNTSVRRIRPPRGTRRRTRERVEVWELALRSSSLQTQEPATLRG
ncbi:MAG: methyltransferase, partial [Myxococcota bacterium]